MSETTTSRASRSRLPRDQRVAEILLAARQALREKGSEQFLVSDVAARCGVSEATIYKYFATRRDLLMQVAESLFEEFLAEPPPYGRMTSFRDRLLQVIWHALSIVRREPALTRFVLMELRADPDYRKMGVYELNRRIAQRVTDVVEEGVARGEARPGLPMKLVRDIIFGAIEHQTWAYLRGEGDFSAEETAEGIADILVEGVARRGAGGAALDRTAARLEALADRLAARLDASE